MRQSRYLHFVTKPPDDVDEKQFAARELSPAEAAALLGDFYVYTQRPAEARPLLEQAMSLDPKLAGPLESMGTLYVRAGKLDEALPWYEKAVELDSKSFLAHYSYAMLSLQNSPVAEASLRRAIELRPNFAPAYAALAQLYGMSGERLEEALQLAKEAVKLEPGTLSHRVTMANVLLEMDRIDEAKGLAQRIAASAKSPNDQMMARNLMSSIQSYEQHQAELKYYEEERQRFEQALKEEALRREAEERARKEQESQQETSPQPAPTRAGKGRGAPKSPGGVTAPGQGTVVAVTCDGAKMDLALSLAGETIKLHSENYFQIEYLTTKWEPPPNFNPCRHLKGRYVQAEYRVVIGKSYDGEIVSIQVRR